MSTFQILYQCVRSFWRLDLTSWYNYRTSRHYFLSGRHNIWQVSIIFWQVDLMILMIIFFKLAAILLSCVDFIPRLLVRRRINASWYQTSKRTYSIVSARKKKWRKFKTSNFKNQIRLIIAKSTCQILTSTRWYVNGSKRQELLNNKIFSF